MNICAPDKYDKNSKSCFTTNQLIEMTKAYNRYVTKQRMAPSRNNNFNNAELIKIKSDKEYLIDNLMKRFNNVCNGNEICLTQQDFMNDVLKEVRDDIENDTFRPNGPAKSTEWLSTTDINNIMKQYETVFPGFKFMGAVPLDCNDHSFCSLYQINFNEHENNGITKMGVVFNHDRYGESGSHWVALYINIEAGEIYFCDSMGKEPIGNIKHVIKSYMDYYKKKTGTNAIYRQNTKSYQKDQSECGVYSCNFIIRNLNGEKFEDIVNNPLTFQGINSCRNVYFRNKTSKFKENPMCDPRIY